MSMNQSRPAAWPADHVENHVWSTLLADAVRARRDELGLTVDECALRADMHPSRWMAVERGAWIPNERSEVRAIAEALHGDTTRLSFLALVSRQHSQL